MVKRYDAYYKDNLGYYGHALLREEHDGNLVQFTDYDALAARLAEEQAESKRLRGHHNFAIGRADRAEARLAKYGTHMDGCMAWRRPMPDGTPDPTQCTCGWTADSADPVIHAQHDETGRLWSGPRSQMPRRYFEVCTDADYEAQVRNTETVSEVPK